MIRLQTRIELKFLNSCFERILLLKLDKQLRVEQFEATVSQSTVTSPPSETWGGRSAGRRQSASIVGGGGEVYRAHCGGRQRTWGRHRQGPALVPADAEEDFEDIVDEALRRLLDGFRSSSQPGRMCS